MPQTSLTHASTPTPSEPPPKGELGFRARALDGVAFSNLLPAAIAAGLSLTASHALAAANPQRWALLAASGTFVVYGLDRLRDTTRDRTTAPRRTEFTEKHARALSIAVALAALLLVATLFTAPMRVILLCVVCGTTGLLHRRLKGLAALKSIYVSAAWVAICAGIPAISGAVEPYLAWVATIFFAALTANLVASNLRDDEAQLLPGRPHSALTLARALTAAGGLAAWVAPQQLAPLGWIPLAEAVALGFFRPSEHYGHLAVDGALLAGALASLLHFASH
ncbi:MAG: hypothetical protein CL933_05325 [Deltaproteobacteria bacterium]|nr:hypothetical protein [Deltaproteobacteria bacterium]